MENNVYGSIDRQSLNRRVYELIPGNYVVIYSDSIKGLMGNYFSKQIVKEDISDLFNDQMVTYIYNLSEAYSLENSIEESDRSKKMKKGYYNLHHFGESIEYRHIGRTFYFVGHVKDCNVAIWSFCVKWICSLGVDESLLHLKATGINLNGCNILLIGDKGAGKSTFVYELSKRIIGSIGLLANTHVLVDEDRKAMGVYSLINFRKNVAEEIQHEKKIMQDKVIKGCTNIDPTDLGYERIKDCKFDKIIFYRYNKTGTFKMEKLSKEEMEALVLLYSYGIQFYSLRTDVMDFYNGDWKKTVQKFERDKKRIKELVAECDSYTLSFDSYTETYWNELIKELEERRK